MDNNKPILGTTIYSFTNEWLQRMYTLEEEVQKVAELDLGPAVEIVGFQSLREYPDVSDESARHFRELLDRHGLIPSCLGGNCDVGRDSEAADDRGRDRRLRGATDRERRRSSGSRCCASRASSAPRSLRGSLPLRKEAGVQVAGEVHSPLSAHHPEIMELRECFDRVGPELVGFVPDFSSSMSAPPDLHWKRLRDLGAPERSYRRRQGCLGLGQAGTREVRCSRGSCGTLWTWRRGQGSAEDDPDHVRPGAGRATGRTAALHEAHPRQVLRGRRVGQRAFASLPRAHSPCCCEKAIAAPSRPNGRATLSPRSPWASSRCRPGRRCASGCSVTEAD